MFGLFQKKEDFRSLFEQAKVMNGFTPDLVFLEQFEYQLLFEYGDMKERHPFHEMIAEAGLSAGAAFTAKPYSMWKHKLGKDTYPVAINRPFHSAPSLPIRGELYLVRPHQFTMLDKHRKNTVLFKRRRIKLVLPYRKVIKGAIPNLANQINHSLRIPLDVATFVEGDFVQEVYAWMYFGIADKIPLDGGYSFCRAEMFTRNKPIPSLNTDQYYYFSRMEYGLQQNS